MRRKFYTAALFVIIMLVATGCGADRDTTPAEQEMNDAIQRVEENSGDEVPIKSAPCKERYVTNVDGGSSSSVTVTCVTDLGPRECVISEGYRESAVWCDKKRDE